VRTSLIIVITFKLIFPCLSQQDALPAFPNEIKGDGVYPSLAIFIPENRLFTGILVEEKTNRKLGEFLNGYKNGLFTSYYRNGKKRMEGSYHLGIKEGIHLEWFESGEKRSEISFNKGTFNGPYTEWYSNRKKKYTGTYSGGIKNGLHSEWAENGVKISEIYYELGNLNGRYTIWNTDGTKLMDGFYAHGRKDGTHHEWYDSGTKKSEITYVNGNRNGVSSEWFLNSQLMVKYTYLNGEVEDGTYTIYQDNGEKEKEITYKNGLKTNEGVYKSGILYSFSTTYYEGSKNKKTEGFLKDGIRDGEWNAWYENGIKKWSGIYEDNKQDSIWSWFFDDGELSNQEEYVNGDLTKVLYENKVHPSLSIKSKLKSDAILYMCVSGLFLDTAFVSVTINSDSKNDKIDILKQRKKLGETVLSAISRRFTYISDVDAMRVYGKKRLDYEIVFSDPIVSTTYDDGKSISKIGLLMVSSQVSPGYRANASIRMKVIDLGANTVLYDQIIDGKSNIYAQKEIALSKTHEQVLNPLINKLFGLFKIKASFEEIKTLPIKGDIKSMTILCGGNLSLNKGFTFFVFDSANPDKALGRIIIEEVKWDSAICKIDDGEDIITNYLSAGKKLVAISSYNP
jgi:antitoxin component YwqK of YwqJK toxin-antitoxin module